MTYDTKLLIIAGVIAAPMVAVFIVTVWNDIRSRRASRYEPPTIRFATREQRRAYYEGRVKAQEDFMNTKQADYTPPTVGGNVMRIGDVTFPLQNVVSLSKVIHRSPEPDDEFTDCVLANATEDQCRERGYRQAATVCGITFNLIDGSSHTLSVRTGEIESAAVWWTEKCFGRI